ncbi:MAG: Bax inhibitor-1/YccA family protein [Mycoplasmataceae bacterium]|nr:Bax inhibitor-1/YccA family protein [Mycoplasmataceae bacterium]
MSNYRAVVNSQGQFETKKQTSILSKSLIVGGVAFGITFAFSLLLYFLLNKYISNENQDIVTSLYVISIICIIATLVLSLFTLRRIEKIKLALLIWMIVLYAIGNGLSFGVLFYAISLSQSSIDMYDIIICFLLTCGIFAISGTVGTMLSARFTLSLGKFLMIATFAFLISFLILMFISLFTHILGSEKINILIWAIWGVMIILYIMYDLSVISKSQQFIQMSDSPTQTKYVFMFGFMLFVNLIQLFWVMIRLMLSLKR